MGDALEAVAVTCLLGSAALEIVHMALAHLVFAGGAARVLMIMAVVGVRAEGYLVNVVAIAGCYRLAGDRSKPMAVRIAIVSGALNTTLNLVQMELNSAITILTHSLHLMKDWRLSASTDSLCPPPATVHP